MTEQKNENLTGFQKLIKIQTELKAPKGQYNSFGKFSFRSAEDILEAVKPFLAKYNVFLNINDKIVSFGQEQTEKSQTLRVYVEATATLYSDDGTIIMSATASAREPSHKTGMDEAQVTGASSSYARKYALNGLFAIDDGKDADSEEGKKPAVKKSVPEPLNF